MLKRKLNVRMTKIHCLLISFIIVICFSSCCKTVECDSWRAKEIKFVNFSDNDLDVFSIRKYTKNTSFIRVIDSVVISKPYHIYIKNGNTVTITFNDSFMGDFFIQPGYDYDFVFWNTSTTIKRITEISNIQSSEKFCNTGFAKKICYNNLSSLKVDGVQSASLIISK